VVGALAAWLMKAREPRPRVTVSRETSLALAQREGASEAERARVLAAHVREEILGARGARPRAAPQRHGRAPPPRAGDGDARVGRGAGRRAQRRGDRRGLSAGDATRRGRAPWSPSSTCSFRAAPPGPRRSKSAPARRAERSWPGPRPRPKVIPSLAGSRLEARTRQASRERSARRWTAHAFEAPLGVWSTPLASPARASPRAGRGAAVSTCPPSPRRGSASRRSCGEEARERARDAAVQKLFERWEVELPDGRVKGALELVGPGALVAPVSPSGAPSPPRTSTSPPRSSSSLALVTLATLAALGLSLPRAAHAQRPRPRGARRARDPSWARALGVGAHADLADSHHARRARAWVSSARGLRLARHDARRLPRGHPARASGPLRGVRSPRGPSSCRASQAPTCPC
jgi:hypothetical protein